MKTKRQRYSYKKQLRVYFATLITKSKEPEVVEDDCCLVAELNLLTELEVDTDWHSRR